MTKEEFQVALCELLVEYARNGGYDDQIGYSVSASDGYMYTVTIAKGKSRAQVMVERAFKETAKK